MLARLHEQIDSRTREIAATHGAWPCRKGCDACCRRLADLPRLTRPEWALLREGLARLPEPVQREIEVRVRTLSAVRPIVCPFLDAAAGACLVYPHRPVACRTYGFYVERDGGLYCNDIQALVESGACEGIVWGNHAAVERELDALGERLDVQTWYATSP